MGQHVLSEHEVRVVGANNWMMLYDGDALVAHASHWRVDWSEHGPGSALFVWADQVCPNPMLLTDNVPMAEWIAAELIAADSIFSGALEAQEATFEVGNATPSSLTLEVVGGRDSVTVSWSELGRPCAGYTRLDPEDTHSHSACYIPAMAAAIEVNGSRAGGAAVPEQWFDFAASSAFLAQAEVWVRRGGGV